MFAISQTSNGYYCLEWVPSEDGPKIIKHKKIQLYQKNNNIKDFPLNEIVERFNPTTQAESNSLSISLNNNSVNISTYNIEPLIDTEFSIKWYEENILGSYFIDNYDIFYYPFSDKRLMVISISKELRKNIIQSSKELNYNLQHLTLDLFSSNIFAQKIIKSNDISNYILWKIGNNNKHYILYNVYNKDGCNYKSYLTLRTNYKLNKIDILYRIGPDDLENKIINFMKSVLFDIGEANSNIFDKVFLYQTKDDKKNINKILDKNFSNCNIINLADTFFKQKVNDNKNLSFAKYAEIGNSLRGIDV